MDNFEGKNILILGFGREGQSTYQFLKKHIKNLNIAIADKKECEKWDSRARHLIKKDNPTVICGEEYLKNLEKYEVIFKTPGIPGTIKEIKEAVSKGVEIITQTKLFLSLCRGGVVGVTGTKGKSTTASLIYHILNESGVSAVLLGNIGKPPLDYLEEGDENTWFVFEMSSHQLVDIDKSPHISIFLNIFKEHLDYYDSFEDYFYAKENITRFQTKKDHFIYNGDVPELNQAAKKTQADKHAFSYKDKGAECYFEKGNLFLRTGKDVEKIITADALPLIGKHNINNVLASIITANIVGISSERIAKALKTFTPLKTRLETIGKHNGITFVSDTLATIPEATIAALEAYKGTVSTLICGGFDRGQDFKLLAKKIIELGVDNLILFPVTGKKIKKEMQSMSDNNINYYSTDSMEEAVKFAYKHTKEGKVCLLSAASPSFSVFKDYQEEAELFKKFVENDMVVK